MIDGGCEFQGNLIIHYYREIRVLGAEKGMKTLAGNELGKNVFKEDVWGDILSGQDSVIMEDG